MFLVKTSLSQDNTAIDFSGGEVDLVTGALCVQVEEEREVVEQDTEQQCTQQIVRQGNSRGDIFNPFWSALIRRN